MWAWRRQAPPLLYTVCPSRVYSSGGACLRHADLQQPCLSGGGRYAAKAMLIYPMYVYKIEVVS